MKRRPDHDAKELERMRNRAMKFDCPVIIPFLKWDIIERDGLSCYLCGKMLTFRTATIDHLTPLCRGGWHSPDNARLACRKCNTDKGNLTEKEYQETKNAEK